MIGGAGRRDGGECLGTAHAATPRMASTMATAVVARALMPPGPSTSSLSQVLAPTRLFRQSLTNSPAGLVDTVATATPARTPARMPHLATRLDERGAQLAAARQRGERRSADLVAQFLPVVHIPCSSLTAVAAEHVPPPRPSVPVPDHCAPGARVGHVADLHRPVDGGAARCCGGRDDGRSRPAGRTESRRSSSRGGSARASADLVVGWVLTTSRGSR